MEAATIQHTPADRKHTNSGFFRPNLEQHQNEAAINKASLV